MKGRERRIECTFLEKSVFVEKVSILPADTSVEKELGRHPPEFKVLSAGCKLCTFSNSELKQKCLNLFGFLSSLNHSLFLDILTNVFPI